MPRYTTVAILGGSLALLSLLAHPARADEKGEALLREVTEATKKVRSLTADIKTTYRVGQRDMKMTGKFQMQRPNLARVEITGQPMNQTVVSNGKDLFIVLKEQKQYIKQKAAADGSNVQGGFFLGGLFFKPDFQAMLGSLTGNKSVSPDLKGEEERDGVKYQVLEVAGEKDRPTLHLYVTPAKLVQGIVLEQKAQEQTIRVEEFFVNVKKGVPLAAKLFAFTPPAGYKVYSPPRYDEKLLAIGKEAPAFELSHPTDKSKISLAKALDGRKAVLVNFWFYG